MRVGSLNQGITSGSSLPFPSNPFPLPFPDALPPRQIPGLTPSVPLVAVPSVGGEGRGERGQVGLGLQRRLWLAVPFPGEQRRIRHLAISGPGKSGCGCERGTGGGAGRDSREWISRKLSADSRPAS